MQKCSKRVFYHYLQRGVFAFGESVDEMDRQRCLPVAIGSSWDVGVGALGSFFGALPWTPLEGLQKCTPGIHPRTR